MQQTITKYYWLAKPGIIYGNSITAIGGFFLAANGAVNFWLFLAMLVGISLVMGSACVYNNYIDRGIDQKMERTKKRPTVTGSISPRSVLIYATVLGVLGFASLAFFVNLLTVWVAFFGFFFYVVMYSMWKRRSIYGTLVGAMAGAVPPVVGYCAVTDTFDLGAVLLFMILVFWQMPHFYAIAMYRSKDYEAASIPVLPLKKGTKRTKIEMLVYIALFVLACLLLTAYGYTGITFAIIMIGLGAWWLGLSVLGFFAPNDEKWARKLFGFSLIVLMTFSITISLNLILP